MQCDLNAEKLGAYLDGELTGGEGKGVAEHIAGCPRCAAEIAGLVVMKRSLRAARGQFAPSDALRRRVRQQIAMPTRRAWWHAWSLGMLPVSALALVMALVAVGFIARANRSDAFGEVADLHINAMASANPVDVVSTDRHTVKPWFQGRIPFSFNVPELGGSEYTLLGGRMVYFHQRPGAQLIVTMKQHRISVLIFQESPELARAFAVPAGVRLRNSYGVETWESQDLRFVMISDADAAGIDGLAQRMKAANP